MATAKEEKFSKDVYQIFLIVLTNDRNQLEKYLNYWTTDYTRSILSEEVRLLTLKDSLLKGSEIVLKLQTCNIESLTSTHLAAYKGYDDLLTTLLTNDEALLNIRLKNSDIGLLHLASFGGHISTVVLLVEVFQVDIEDRDKCGWRPLHFASCGGHFQLVKTLVSEKGAICDARDEDGATAAFRALVNGFGTIANFLTDRQNVPDVLIEAELNERTLEKSRRASEPSYRAFSKKDRQISTSPEFSKSAKYRTVRQLIRDEVRNLKLKEQGQGEEKEETYSEPINEMLLENVGENTLKEIVQHEIKNINDDTNDDPIYASIDEDLLSTGPVNIAPPVPPRRNSSKTSMEESEDELPILLTESMKFPTMRSNCESLQACIQRLSRNLGDQWRHLARALPIEKGGTNKVNNRIKAIERKYPDNEVKQAESALAEWRINAGRSASTEVLIDALETAKLDKYLPIIYETLCEDYP
ncbi:DgyrCDS14270 [Dimorphilus gyrociliatus]|uniref:DgyrCDS14270 n=1 Tax=Dimorphilus gyrociliatus TaxID=2664684 RepID=A0A7I8WD58_9ANNE|nr:DgyrCDS14270 [Dimorphilus gyrociliatus]